MKKKTNSRQNGMLEDTKKFISGLVVGVITSIIASYIINWIGDTLHPKYKIGEIITFGQYEQDNDLSNGPEPLEWYVIAEDSGKYLLLSKYVLDTHKYHDENIPISWEKCSLREWLNNSFISSTFSSKELKKIVTVNNINDNNEVYSTLGGNTTLDKVFLLSVDEAERFLTRDIAYGISTPYAYAKGAYMYNPGYVDENTDKAIINTLEDGTEITIGISKECFWLLRTPGYSQDLVTRVRNSYYADTFSNIGVFIDYLGITVESEYEGIRPAIWYES